MYEISAKRTRSNWLSLLLLAGSIVLVVGVLRWAREILIPIAMAVLATFILSPIVTLLRRKGLGRTPSVMITMGLVFALVAGIGTVLFVQLRALATELPAYRQNILQKIADLRIASRGGAIENLQQMAREVLDELNKEGEQAVTPAAEAGAVPVVIKASEAGETLPVSLAALLQPLATLGLVIVLSIFMLLRREELRDRIVRLAGYGRLVATTRAIDAAGRQVSRYLLRHSLLNAGFGVCVGTGLFLIGLPYAALWGFLAGVARFIPYVGPWIGAAAPILVSLAVFDNWTTPVLIMALVIGLELLNNMVLEPMVYGSSIGVSEVALLIMVAFWTWLWGPIGLVLAAPMTVCLMVISKGVPDLDFIAVLLSSEPPLVPYQVFYQRLLARDRQEAEEIAETYLRQHSASEFYENLLIPALVACRHDADHDRLSDAEREFVLEAVGEMIDLPSTVLEVVHEEPAVAEEVPLAVGWPAADEAEQLALRMFAATLSPQQVNMHVLPADRLVSENLLEIEQRKPALVCVAVLPGGAAFPVRQLAKRLRARAVGIPLVIAAWGMTERERTSLRPAEIADAVGVTFAETKSHIVQLARIQLSQEVRANAPKDARDSTLPA